jgi:hypothetical protein
VADLPSRYRQPVCARSNQYRFVAVYARAADRPDRYWAHVDAIRTAVKRANAFVHDEARRAGVNRLDLRFQCRGKQIEVVNAVVATPSSTDSFETVEYDLKKSGLNDSLAKYWVWYDDATSTGACGEARRTGDGSLSEANRSNQGPDFAVAYAHITACGSVASTLLHEATHTMGAVADAAWGTDRRGHCADGRDVMCTSGRLCPTLRYDCGNDTYFDPAPRRGEYLYTHWNIAFCINRFISRTGCITQPRNLRASYSGYGVTLHWTGPANTGGAPLQIYEIYRRACNTCPLHRIDTVSGSRRSYTDVNLGFRYEYRVRAINVWQDGGPLSNLAAGGIL